jgi:hypothetical protein
MPKTLKLQELIKQYEFVCNEWVQKFCNKQGLEFDGWVAEEVNGVASFTCQYFFNLNEIVLDLTTKQPKGFILDWQNDVTDFNMGKDEKEYINYKSYIMGLRYTYLKKVDG